MVCKQSLKLTLEKTIMREVTALFILPMMFVLLGNPVFFNSMSPVWREFLGAF